LISLQNRFIANYHKIVAKIYFLIKVEESFCCEFSEVLIY